MKIKIKGQEFSVNYEPKPYSHDVIHIEFFGVKGEENPISKQDTEATTFLELPMNME